LGVGTGVAAGGLSAGGVTEKPGQKLRQKKRREKKNFQVNQLSTKIQKGGGRRPGKKGLGDKEVETGVGFQKRKRINAVIPGGGHSINGKGKTRWRTKNKWGGKK